MKKLLTKNVIIFFKKKNKKAIPKLLRIVLPCYLFMNNISFNHNCLDIRLYIILKDVCLQNSNHNNYFLRKIDNTYNPVGLAMARYVL